MQIRPQEFEVSEKELRQRLSLPSSAIVFPFGFEGISDDSLIRMLKLRYDVLSLYFRTRPDFLVLDGIHLYLVEAKQRTQNVEAIQLFFNKILERIGIKVVYSFPEVSIRACHIPMETVVIPENHKEKFDENLKHFLVSEGVTDFRYVRQVEIGSGDAFVPVDVEDLQLLSEESSI